MSEDDDDTSMISIDALCDICKEGSVGSETFYGVKTCMIYPHEEANNPGRYCEHLRVGQMFQHPRTDKLYAICERPEQDNYGVKE